MKNFSIKALYISLAILWILLIPSQVTSQTDSIAKVRKNYRKYYQLTGRAEHLSQIAERQSVGNVRDSLEKKALELYIEAFYLVPQGNKEDLIKAFYLAYGHNKIQKAKTYLKKAFIGGWTLEGFEKHKKTIPGMLNDPVLQKVLEPYEDHSLYIIKALLIFMVIIAFCIIFPVFFNDDYF